MKLSRRGFTLFEIIVVLAIITFVGILVYPSMKTSIDKARMDASIRDLAALLKYAREKALAEQETIAAVIRREEKDLTLFDRRGQSIKHYKLWEKVYFDRVLLDGEESLDNRVVVWFYPDGRSTGVAMVVRNDIGRQLRLKTDLLTGNTRIFQPGEKGFDDEILK